MKITSYSELRRNLVRVIDEAADDHEPVLITRDRGKPAAVLMSLEDFASYEETAYLLRSPANAEQLRHSLKELEAGLGKEKKLIGWGSSSVNGLGETICIGRVPTVATFIR